MSENYRDELYHHGIKGMKWGVRRYQNSDGSYTAAGKDRYGRRLGNLNSRISKHQSKLDRAKNKKGKENFIYRNTVGDWRRGRVAHLKTIKKNVEAKRDYKHNKNRDTKEALSKARVERLAKNGLGVGPDMRGAYNRYRNNGNTMISAGLKSYGKTVATSVVVGGAAYVATKHGRQIADVVMDQAQYQMFKRGL